MTKTIVTQHDLENEIEDFYRYYLDNFKTFEQGAEYYKSLLNSLVSDECEIQSISFRIKDKEECINKFKRKYFKDLEVTGEKYEIKNHITDIIGLRIVCLYESEIEKIQSILSNNFKVIDITDKIKSLDSTDNQFGYKSLHIDLRLNDERKKLPEFKKFADITFEVQIRTIIQDAWSVLDHKIKYKKSIPPKLKRRINLLAALFEIADEEFYNIKLGTKDFEEKAKSDVKPNEPLNVLSFMSIVGLKFSTYQFLAYKADGFVHELQLYDNSITVTDFQSILDKHLELVKKYNSEIIASSPANYLNPYTMLRHCLYLSDKELFSKLLFMVQRKKFDEWLKGQTS